MHIVIIGGSFAGVSAALSCKTYYPQAKITLIEKGTGLAYIANSLNEYLKGKLADLKNGYAYSIKDLQSKGINCLLNHEVTKIDSTNQILYVKASGDSMTLTYDYLILAMGGKGFTEEPVAALIDPHSYESSLKSFEKLQKAKTVLIVGGGPIGIEACEAYQRAGKDVTLLEAYPSLAVKYLDKPISQAVERLLVSHGVNVHKRELVNKIVPVNDTIAYQVITNNSTYLSDCVQFATNFTPNINLVENQIALLADRSVAVDEYLATSLKHTFAVGDLIQIPVGLHRKSLYWPSIQHSITSGSIAAANLIVPTKALPSSETCLYSKLYGYNLLSLGMTASSAEEEGIVTFTSTYVSQKGGQIFIISKADDGQILGIQWLSLAPLQAELALLMTGLQAKFSEDDFLVQAPPFYSGKSLIQFDLYKALYHHKSLRQKEAHLC